MTSAEFAIVTDFRRAAYLSLNSKHGDTRAKYRRKALAQWAAMTAKARRQASAVATEMGFRL